MCRDLFSIGPITIQGYGVCIAIGVIIAYFVSEIRAKRKGLRANIVFSLVVSFLIGGFFGAKMIYLFTLFANGELDIKALLNVRNGYVVYGGIIGGVLGIFMLCKVKKIDFWTYLDLVIPAVVLAQGFGRIGCFMAGCCYGQETESILGVMFPANSMAPSGVKLFPIQLCFSLFDFILFFVLIAFAKRRCFEGKISALYIMIYAIGRFVLENFRGDKERGSVGALSTSQFISIFILFVGIGLYFVMKQKKNRIVLREEV